MPYAAEFVEPLSFRERMDEAQDAAAVARHSDDGLLRARVSWSKRRRYVTVCRAAELLEVSEQMVRRLLKARRIAGSRKHRGAWRVALGPDGLPARLEPARGPMPRITPRTCMPRVPF